MRNAIVGTAELKHVQVEAEHQVHQAGLLRLGEVLWQRGVDTGGEDRLQLVDQLPLQCWGVAVCHPDEEEGEVAAPVVLTVS